MKKLIFCIITIFLINFIYSQGVRTAKINEILVFNKTNYIDDYGQHTSWIEIFNPAYNPVNIATMYITNDRNNPKKYRIPEAGRQTIIPPRGFLILFADGITSKGAFHLNFTLDSTGFLAIYDSDGKTLLDSVSYPLQRTDVTYGRVEDGVDVWTFLDESTPKSSNVIEIREKTAEIFARMDPYGGALTIISMSVVFLALLVLFLLYKTIGNFFMGKYKNINILKNKKKVNETIPIEKTTITGEENAAIALALHLFINETHDFENTTITIKKVSKTYSPWSSKIYSVYNLNNLR